MADRYLSFTGTGPGRFLPRRLGLPQPAPLRRWSAVRPGGRVAATASIAGIAGNGRNAGNAGNAGQTNHAASKAGVVGLVRSLAPRAPYGTPA